LPPETQPIASPPAPAKYVSRFRLPGFAWLAILGLLLVGVALPAYEMLRNVEQPLDAFWNPVFSSSNQILLCIGNQAGGHTLSVGDRAEAPPLVTLKEFHNSQSQTVTVADATALARFAGFMQSRGKSYRVVSHSETTYSELQRSPVVLIGLNNDWAKRLVGNLRYTVERVGGGRMEIRDHLNPSRSDWSIDYYAPMVDIRKDYALVVRATDPKTEQMAVMAAGMSMFGTLAAAQFLTNRDGLRKMAGGLPKNWSRKNIELVLSTEVIRGNPGPPVVVASYVW
jgi:hypothetical protein